MMLQSKRLVNLAVKLLLFGLILGLGTTAVFIMGERPGLALAHLSRAPIRMISTNAQGSHLYSLLNGGTQPNGIYHSLDNGHTWQHISQGPPVEIKTLAVHPANEAVLFAGAAGGSMAAADSLWRSIDGGQTWQRFFFDLPLKPDGTTPAITSLVTDPNQPEVLFVGTEGKGVYRFDVGINGEGHPLLNEVSLNDTYVNNLVIDSDRRVYALTNKGLFVNNYGDWRKLETVPETPISLAVANTNSRILYVGALSSGVYRTTDGGQNWERIGGDWWIISGAALRGTALTVDDQNPDHVVAATAYGIGKKLVGGGIYESYDAGRNWIKVADANGVVTQLVINHGAIYAVAPNGLSRYHEPLESSSAPYLANLSGLADFTSAQIIILGLTIGLAGLILLARIDWVAKFNRTAV